MEQYFLKFYFVGDDGVYCISLGSISAKYAKPSILRKYAAAKGATFVTCSKYGCRQFLAE